VRQSDRDETLASPSAPCHTLLRRSGQRFWCAVDSKSKPLTEFQRGVVTQEPVNQQFVATHTNGFMPRQFWVPLHSSNKCLTSWEAVVGDVPTGNFAGHESCRDRRFSELLKSGAGGTVWLDRQARIFSPDGQAGVCIVQPLRESLHSGRERRVAVTVQKPQPNGSQNGCDDCRASPEFRSPPNHDDDTRRGSRICERPTIAPATAENPL